ncbi:hypothetical protein CFC21_085726 [Triticum aestivum]|uniref:Peptidase M48 domain-containing protein n=2 Tax=Triticum aestivum TaxID=4565 RepID=A0A9R1IDM0_WHEAT|nr:hypothetical protein CFC21_085720 [Triticum aestivum]KAF7081816.1 hypothetical protein CFC21_085726 [Triticum aestivum]
MNCLRNTRLVFSRLQIVRRHFNPAQPLPGPRSHSIVMGSIRRLFLRQAKPAAASHVGHAPSLPRFVSRSRPRWYQNPWKVAAAVVVAPYAAKFILYTAISKEETVPYTNRAHRVLLTSSEEHEFGDEIFNDRKKKYGKDILGPSDPRTVRVRRVASDIIHGVRRLFANNTIHDDDVKQGKVVLRPQTEHLNDLNWEVIVVKDEKINAFSTLGGKIVIYTGYLEHLKTDAELATVIAHEAAHVVARHSMELLSLIPFYKLMPFSRRAELEADHIGLMIMAAAGFDPRVAPQFRKKIGEIIGDTKLMDYICTHPSFETRSRMLSRKEVMEEALELYKQERMRREKCQSLSSLWWNILGHRSC